jgi:hypothetical protein
VIRTTSRATQTLTGNWSTAPTIGALALGRHNLTSHCRWRLELFPAINQGGTVLYDSGTVAPGIVSGWDLNTSVLWLPSAVTPLSFRLTISTTDSNYPAAGYFEASRLVLGPVWSPAVNVAHQGFAAGWHEDSRQVRTGAGSVRAEAGPAYRTLALPLDWLAESERASLWEILRQVGMRQDLLVSVLPGGDSTPERDLAMLAKATDLPDFSYPLPSYWGTQLRLAET